MKRPRMFSHLLVRPVDQAGESQPGYWLRIAHANGLRRVQWMLSTGERWASGMARFCPRCLQAPNPFWRDEWLDPAGYWCAEHSTWLVDTCPSCGRRLQWGFMRFDACMCGHRWPGSATEDVPLRLVLSINSGEATKQVLRLIGALALFGSGGKPGKKSHRSHVQEASEQLQAGLDVLASWPEGFFQALDRHRLLGESAGVQLLNEAFPRLDELIKLLPEGIWRDRVIAGIESYCVRSRNTASPIVGRNAILSTGPKTLKEIATGLRRRTESVARAVDLYAGELVPKRVTQHGRVRRVISEPGLRALDTTMAELVEIKKAARMVALSASRVRAMLKAGILTEIQGRISLSELATLNQCARPCVEPAAFDSGWVSVKEALRRWVHVDSTGAFVRALRSGALTVCAGPDSSALGHGLIPEEALSTWVASLLDPTRSELMLGEVATALGVKHDVVRDLIRVGLLKASVGQMNRRRCWRIAQQEVEDFKRSYVALAELTRESNVRSKDGFAWAREQQLNVVTGPVVDGSRQYFVRRLGCSLATAGASRLTITAKDGGMR